MTLKEDATQTLLSIQPTKAATLGAIGGAIVGGLVTTAIATSIGSKGSSSSSSKKGRGRIKHTKRGWKQDRARFNKRQSWEVAYRKRKRKLSKTRKSRGKIHYARKTGQPYIILASGKAKFIKGKRRK